jgi:enoyl-CoA hydratase/carnithine racemase
VGVLVEHTGAAAVVILDWPDRRNALGPDESQQLTNAIIAAVTPDASGLVLTGNGAFCAGGNLRGAVERADLDPSERRQVVYAGYQGVVRALIDCPVPTVAAVDGPAVGMGFDLALACDSRFVGPDGWCQQGWGRVGLVPGTGGELLLRLRAPNALWAMLEEQPRLDATSLAMLNLAEPVTQGTARERAVARVERLSVMSRESLEAYVALHRAELRALLPAHLEHAVERQLALLASPDFAARVQKVLG